MLDQIYRDIILEHNRSDKNRGELSTATAVERGHNPDCGDDLTLMIKMEDDIIIDAKFIGMGCAISTASMSMMIDIVKGKTRAEAMALAELYFGMIKGQTLSKTEQNLLKDSIIFQNLKNMPARVKCGTLGWHCLKVIVNS